ncbi:MULTISPECIES: hypothetical protein [unclassified Sinorhizobium]
MLPGPSKPTRQPSERAANQLVMIVESTHDAIISKDPMDEELVTSAVS